MNIENSQLLYIYNSFFANVQSNHQIAIEFLSKKFEEVCVHKLLCCFVRGDIEYETTECFIGLFNYLGKML